MPAGGCLASYVIRVTGGTVFVRGITILLGSFENCHHDDVAAKFKTQCGQSLSYCVCVPAFTLHA